MGFGQEVYLHQNPTSKQRPLNKNEGGEVRVLHHHKHGSHQTEDPQHEKQNKARGLIVTEIRIPQPGHIHAQGRPGWIQNQSQAAKARRETQQQQ